MEIDIILADTWYMGYNSLKDYYKNYHDEYDKTKDKENDSLYESFKPNVKIPYCLFTFLYDNYDNDTVERWVYYELVCNMNGVWYVTKFDYPANNKDICDYIVGDYVKKVFA